MKDLTVFQEEVNGELSSLIPLGKVEDKLPGNLINDSQQYSYLYKDGTVTAIPWAGIVVARGMNCLCFPRLKLYAFREIGTVRRGQALSLVRDLATLLTKMDKDFVSPESGVVSLWRIWGIEGGGVMVLPPGLAHLLSSFSDQAEQFAMFNAWVHYDIHPAFSLIDEMAQLLYYGATGVIPFLSDDVREDRFRVIPLSLCRTNLDPKVSEWIDHILHMGLTEQRDIAGNRDPHEALFWFLSQTDGFSWPENPTADRDSEEAKTYLAKQKKRARTRVFWRKKGLIVAAIAAAVAIVGYIVGSNVKRALTPPSTAFSSDEEIITAYYDAQNNLDVVALDEPLAPHVKSPAELEVTNLYVSRQTRQAYENSTMIIDARQWIADGKPEIPDTALIYGVTDLSLTQVDEDTWDATTTLWAPFSYDDEPQSDDTENTAKPEHVSQVYVYTMIQRFTMGTNKKGWRLIYGIENVSHSLDRIENVTTYALQRKSPIGNAPETSGPSDSD